MGLTFGAPHRHFRVTDSTNARARELAGAGAPGGTVVTAAEQTAGRGRQGRTWTAPAGRALLYSAILRPLDERHRLLPLAAPLAVCEAAEELEPRVRCAIKWPNDVWVGERKLAGVLIEARPSPEPGEAWAVIGVGLNLTIGREEFPPELRDHATSLFAAPPSARAAVPSSSHMGGGNSGAKEAVDDALERWVEAGAADVLAAWRERDALRGRAVSWEGGSGVAEGVSESGDLLVLLPGGRRVVLGSGEVHLSV